MESIILLLHSEGFFFYQGSGELQHFKRFCFEKNIIGTTCRFTPKTMNLITSHFVTCLCNTLSGLQMHFTKAHPKLATYSILFMRSRASVATLGHEMSTRSIIGNHATCSRYFDVSQSIIREVCMCYAQVKFRVGEFKHSRTFLDEARSGRLLDATDEEKCKKVRDLVYSDRRIQVEEIAQALVISYSSVSDKV